MSVLEWMVVDLVVMIWDVHLLQLTMSFAELGEHASQIFALLTGNLSSLIARQRRHYHLSATERPTAGNAVTLF